MRTFAQRDSASQKPGAVRHALGVRQHAGGRSAHAPAHGSILGAASPAQLGHDFSRVPTHSRLAGVLQAKLAINTPGDEYEQEADHASERVMRTTG